jgi:excisionase family DNA binding protein
MSASEQDKQPDDPLFQDKNKAARNLGVSRRTVEKLIANGELPSVTVGRRRLIPTSALRNFGKRRHHPTGKPEAAAVGAAQ